MFIALTVNLAGRGRGSVGPVLGLWIPQFTTLKVLADSLQGDVRTLRLHLPRLDKGL